MWGRWPWSANIGTSSIGQECGFRKFEKGKARMLYYQCTACDTLGHQASGSRTSWLITGLWILYTDDLYQDICGCTRPTTSSQTETETGLFHAISISLIVNQAKGNDYNVHTHLGRKYSTYGHLCTRASTPEKIAKNRCSSPHARTR